MTTDHDHDLVLVVDFGAQYAQLIARRVREARVYSEIVPHTMPAEQILAKKPKAIILSGGPQSVYAPGAPAVGSRHPRRRRPGLRHLLRLPGDGGRVGWRGTPHRAVGVRPHRHHVTEARHAVDRHADGHRVWMSHGDAVAVAPEGFTTLARPTALPSQHSSRSSGRVAGVQWHPEVLHTEHGQQVLERFLVDIAGCRQTWTMVNVVEEQVERIRAQVGSKRAICGLSGGVDSAVAAALVQRAIGDQLTCVFVDHGLLRKGEAEQVERDFVAATGVSLRVVECVQDLSRRARGRQRP